MGEWGQGTSWRWRKVRKQVLDRDAHTCQLRHPGCETDAAEVHHLGGVKRRDDYDNPDLCIAVCPPCHRIETVKQAAHGRWGRTKRTPPKHPSDL